MLGRAVPFDFEATPAPNACWAHGTLRAGAPLPADLTVAVAVEPGEGDRVTARLALTSAQSRVSLTGALDAGARIHEGRITGRLASADALALLPGLAPRPVAVVDLDLAAEGTLHAPRLHGRASASSLLLPPLHLEHASAAIDVDLAGLRYRDLACTVRGVRVTGWGEVPFGPPPRGSAGLPLLALRVARAGPSLLAALASLASLPEPSLPADLVLAGEAAIGPTGAASGALTLTTPRSALDLRLTLGPAGELLGSTLRGTLAAADAFAVGRASAPWTLPPELLRIDPSTALTLDLRLAGTLARPGVAGRVAAARASIDAGGGVALAIEDVSALLDAGPDRVAWQRLVGRFCGGAFSSSGHVAIGQGGGALDAEVAWRGVRVQDLPTGPPGERAIASVLRGVSSGALRFERRGLPGQALVARGSVTVASPVYRFARSLTPALGRYGLPPIRARGEGPLAAAVRIEDGELVVEPLTAAVDAAELEGALRLRPDGRLLGRLRVHLRAHYLAGSPILAVPAALMGKVTIPVDLAGTHRRPGATDRRPRDPRRAARPARPARRLRRREERARRPAQRRPAAAPARLTHTVVGHLRDKDHRMATSRAIGAHPPRPSRTAGPARLGGAVVVLYNVLYWPYLILQLRHPLLAGAPRLPRHLRLGPPPPRAPPLHEPLGRPLPRARALRRRARWRAARTRPWGRRTSSSRTTSRWSTSSPSSPPASTTSG